MVVHDPEQKYLYPKMQRKRRRKVHLKIKAIALV
jgi:hypothetical protein